MRQNVVTDEGSKWNEVVNISLKVVVEMEHRLNFAKFKVEPQASGWDVKQVEISRLEAKGSI